MPHKIKKWVHLLKLYKNARGMLEQLEIILNRELIAHTASICRLLPPLAGGGSKKGGTCLVLRCVLTCSPNAKAVRPARQLRPHVQTKGAVLVKVDKLPPAIGAAVGLFQGLVRRTIGARPRSHISIHACVQGQHRTAVGARGTGRCRAAFKFQL